MIIALDLEKGLVVNQQAVGSWPNAELLKEAVGQKANYHVSKILNLSYGRVENEQTIWSDLGIVLLSSKETAAALALTLKFALSHTDRKKEKWLSNPFTGVFTIGEQIVGANTPWVIADKISDRGLTHGISLNFSPLDGATGNVAACSIGFEKSI